MEGYGAMSRDLDWSPEAARELAEGAIELWCELLRTIEARPVSRQFSAESLEAVAPAIPEEPLSNEALLAYARTVLLDFATYAGHPRFMAYITGAGTVPGAVADLLAAALNANVGGSRLGPGATAVETHLTRWFATEVFGMPEGAFGLMTSGGAMASFVALKAARDACAGLSVRTEGISGAGPMAIYASEEAHVVVDRAADMLGLGTQAVRKVPVGADHRMLPSELDRALRADAARGVKPLAVVATAGTVNTGAIDPLEEIAEIAARWRAWLHVDGAYGAVACLSPSLKPLFRGIERADSIAFDAHKWLYVPHSAGCVVVRDPERLKDAFHARPAYVHHDQARTGYAIDLSMYGPQFSRGFNAFKVFFSLLAHGRRPYAESIERDVALARYLDRAVDARSDLERMSEGPLSISCFRYVPERLRGNEAALDALNERIMTELQLDGRAFCSNAVLRGRFVLRTCIVNFRTRERDVDLLLDTVRDLGERLAPRP
jgi:aromatic-L-amino-acid/L-tryptophan decarboxylase